jgi:hypothetical protein
MMGLDVGRIVNSLVRTVAATVVMAEVVALWLICLRGAGFLDLGSKLETGVAVAVGIAAGGAAFFYTSRFLRSDEARVLVDRLPLPQSVRRYAGG